LFTVRLEMGVAVDEHRLFLRQRDALSIACHPQISQMAQILLYGDWWMGALLEGWRGGLVGEY
jgi:hypothetical protein